MKEAVEMKQKEAGEKEAAKRTEESRKRWELEKELRTVEKQIEKARQELNRRATVVRTGTGVSSTSVVHKRTTLRDGGRLAVADFEEMHAVREEEDYDL